MVATSGMAEQEELFCPNFCHSFVLCIKTDLLHDMTKYCHVINCEVDH